MNILIIKNLFANVYGVAVNLVFQILLVPLYINCWGKSLYSDWIVITSLTAFFSITNIGLSTVTQNVYSIEYINNNIKKCNSLLVNNIFLVSLVFICSLIVSIIVLSIIDLPKFLHLSEMNRSLANFIFVSFLIYIYTSMYGTILDSLFRAQSKYHIATFISNTSRLIEVLIIIFCVSCNVSIYLMVSLYLFPGVFFLFYKYKLAKDFIQFSINKKYYDWSLFKQLLIPSVSFLSIPVSYSVLIQGSNLIVNYFFGPNAVVLYTTTRTLSNFITTILKTIKHAIWPEFTVAFAHGDSKEMNKLYKISVILSIFFAILASLVLLFGGDWIYSIWLHGSVMFDASLMFSFVLIIIVHSLWESGSVVLESTNNHIVLGLLFVCLSILTQLLAYVVLTKYKFIDVLPYSQLIMEIIVLSYVVGKINKVIYGKKTNNCSNYEN